MEAIMARTYEMTVILYAVSLVFYFIDYLYKYVKARRIAFWFVSAVWALQTFSLVLSIIETKSFPILSFFDGVFFYAWLLTTLSIILHCIARVDLPVIFINVLGFIFMTIYLFAPNEMTADTKPLISEMLVMHIGFAMLSYVAFTLAFVFALLYIILYRLLKQKKWTTMWSRLPSLQQMGTWMNYSLLVGVPLLFISLIMGVEWALVTLEQFSFFDVKIFGSFILSIMYLIIILLHRSGKLVGMAYAKVQIYAFLLVVINYFLGSKLSNFHIWF